MPGHQGPQGDDPRVPGVRLRRPGRQDEAGDARIATPERPDLLHRYPRTAGTAGAVHRRLRAPRRVAGRRGRARGPHPGVRGAEALALDTGGFVVKNSNDLSGGITRVSSESRAYYLLGYNPTDLRRDGKFRRIEVKLRPPKPKGLSVRAAARILRADRGPGSRQRQQRERRPRDRPRARLAVRVAGRAAAGVELRVRRVGARPGERAARGRDRRGAPRLQAGRRPFHRRARVPDRGPAPRDRRVLPLRPEDRAELSCRRPAAGSNATGIRSTASSPCPRVPTRPRSSSATSTRASWGRSCTSSRCPRRAFSASRRPVLSDALEQGSDGSQRPLLQVRRAFRRRLDPLLPVLGLRRGAGGDGLADAAGVSAGYEIRRRDGFVFKRSAPTPINPTSVGALLRLNGISLRGAAPGGTTSC